MYGERTLVERRLDTLAPARDLPRTKSRRHSDGQHEARGHARSREVEEYRTVAPAGLLVLEPCARLDERVVARDDRRYGSPTGTQVPMRRRVAGTWRRCPRRRAQIGPSFPARSSPRARRRRKAGRGSSARAFIVCEVEGDRSAAPVPDRRARYRSHRVASRRLHLHDLSSLLREQQDAERSCDASGQIEDPHAGECTARAQRRASWKPLDRRRPPCCQS